MPPHIQRTIARSSVGKTQPLRIRIGPAEHCLLEMTGIAEHDSLEWGMTALSVHGEMHVVRSVRRA